MKHLHRAHLRPLGVDSNSEQFARAGNPWDGDGQLRVRKGRAKPKRLPCRSSRETSPAFEDLQARRALWAKMDAARGKRAFVPTDELPDNIVARTVAHPNRAELKPLTAKQRERSGWQKLETQCRIQAGEAAYRASEAAKLAEKRRLESIIAAAEARLASM